MKFGLDAFKRVADIPPGEVPLTRDQKNALAVTIYDQLELIMKKLKRDIDIKLGPDVRLDLTIYERSFEFPVIQSQEISKSPLHVRVSLTTDFPHDPEFSLHIRGPSVGFISNFDKRTVLLDENFSLDRVHEIPSIILTEFLKTLSDEETQRLNLGVNWPWNFSNYTTEAKAPAPPPPGG